jgi:hypothetical protein
VGLSIISWVLNFLSLNVFYGKPTRLLVFLAVFLFFISCGGGGNSDSGGHRASMPTTYLANFYDENLDLINSVEVDIANPELNITKAKDDAGISSLYTASSLIPVLNETIILTNDINFYTVSNVVEISSQIELNTLRDNLSGKYILINDINLIAGEAGFHESEGWKPIGNSSDSFKGILNGNSHKITNLWINSPNSYVGLFGRISNAAIKNIGVETEENRNISGNSYVGGIAGWVESNSIISNSYSAGNINGSYYVGGIAGFVMINSTITNSYFSGDISGNQGIGGIAGFVINNSAVTNSCYMRGGGGVISGKNQYVGGITGAVEINSIIANSYSAGSINGYNLVGGIAGYATLNSTISNSYAKGDVNGREKYVGGIAGEIDKGNTVKNSAAVNPSVIGIRNVNRIAEFISGSTALNNFANSAIKINGAISADSDNNGIGKSLADFKAKSTYETDLGWSFGDNDTSPWKIDENKNNGLPYLYWQEL